MTSTIKIDKYVTLYRSKFPFVAILLLATVSGCSESGRATVSGQVTLDGELIEVGSIVFFPSNPRAGKGTGGRIQDGEYLLEGKAAPAIGSYRVQIRSMRKSGRMVRPAYAGPDTPMVEGTEEAVAAEYNDKTTLEIEVMPGHNEKNWEVESRERNNASRPGIPGL